MPIQQIPNLEWANANALRAYPLSDEVTEKDTTGSFTIPRSLLIDFRMVVPASLDLVQTGFYVSQVAIFGTGVNITISYDDGSGAEVVGIVAVATASHVPNYTYFINGTGSLDGCLGKVTIGPLEDTLAYGGVFNFDLTGARILPQLFVPNIRGVESLRFSTGVETTDDLYGTIWLEAGRNIQFRILDQAGHTDDPAYKIVYIDALQREDLNKACNCAAQTEVPPAITSINGIPPNPDGSFYLVGDDCISFNTGGNGTIQVRDQCSTPCCGSEELRIIEEDLKNLNLDSRSQRAYMDRIESHMLTLDTYRQMVNQLLSLSFDWR